MILLSFLYSLSLILKLWLSHHTHVLCENKEKGEEEDPLCLKERWEKKTKVREREGLLESEYEMRPKPERRRANENRKGRPIGKDCRYEEREKWQLNAHPPSLLLYQCLTWHPFLSVTTAQSNPVHSIGGQLSTISLPRSAMTDDWPVERRILRRYGKSEWRDYCKWMSDILTILCIHCNWKKKDGQCRLLWRIHLERLW